MKPKSLGIGVVGVIVAWASSFKSKPSVIWDIPEHKGYWALMRL